MAREKPGGGWIPPPPPAEIGLMQLVFNRFLVHGHHFHFIVATLNNTQGRVQSLISVHNVSSCTMLEDV